MSFIRLVYYSTIICGWAAFFGWLVSEPLFRIVQSTGSSGSLNVMLVCCLVGAAIAAGLNLVTALSNNTPFARLGLGVLVGLIGGAIGGGVGGLVGNLTYSMAGRVLGFAVLGFCVGSVGGIFERSLTKIRNGVVGGSLGGLIGGIVFDPLSVLGSGMSGRATAFVILGLCIGALIGLVQVVMKEAWLTVVDGYRPGRRLILSQTVTTVGRAEHLPLAFIGASNQELDLEHLRIVRQGNGSYVVEDNNSTKGVSVNRNRVSGSHPLQDNDVIKFGTNHVRFNERKQKERADAETVPGTDQQPQTNTPTSPGRRPPPPPPRTKKKTASKTAATPHSAPGSSQLPKTPSPTSAASPSPGKPKGPPPPPPRKKKS
ncbi:MAG TPA: FHA domain-containing protein [Nitrospirales bacterium]|nr:FHA domain-containing protein [Nitrospirales bacterium]